MIIDENTFQSSELSPKEKNKVVNHKFRWINDTRNRNFFTRIHDPQISNQIDTADNIYLRTKKLFLTFASGHSGLNLKNRDHITEYTLVLPLHYIKSSNI